MSNARRLLVLLIVAALVLPAVLGASGARPPPQAICAVCAEAEERETVGGVTIEATAASTTIRIRENGSGHWTSRVELNDAAARRLAGNDTLRREFVEAALSGYAAADDPRRLASRVDDRTLVVEYDVEGMAHRSVGGVLLVDYFYWGGDDARWFRLGADRVVLRGPNGTVATHAPGDAKAGDGRVVWTAGDDDWTTLDRSTHVAFAANDGVAARAGSLVAVQADVLQAIAPALPVVVPVPLAVLAAVLALLAFRGEWLAALSWPRKLGVVAGASAALAVLSAASLAVVEPDYGVAGAAFGWLLALSGAVVLVGLAPLVVGLQVALATGWRPWVEFGLPDRAAVAADDRPLRSVEVATVGAVVALLAGAALASLLAGGRPWTGLGTGLLAAPVALFVPLGASERLDSRDRHGLRAAIVATPVVLAVWFGPYGGYASALLPVYLAPWAVLTGAAGSLAWLLGRALVAPAADEAAG